MNYPWNVRTGRKIFRWHSINCEQVGGQTLLRTRVLAGTVQQGGYLLRSGSSCNVTDGKQQYKTIAAGAGEASMPELKVAAMFATNWDDIRRTETLERGYSRCSTL